MFDPNEETTAPAPEEAPDADTDMGTDSVPDDGYQGDAGDESAEGEGA